MLTNGNFFVGCREGSVHHPGGISHATHVEPGAHCWGAEEKNERRLLAGFLVDVLPLVEKEVVAAGDGGMVLH